MEEYIYKQENYKIVGICIEVQRILGAGLIFEVKAVSGITKEHIAQTINYIKLTQGRLGIIANFGNTTLEHKRIIL